MRWLIGVLILANLAIFAWSSLQGPAVEPEPLVEPGVGNIRLLREVVPEQPAAAAVEAEATSIQAAEVPAPVVMAPAGEAIEPAPAQAMVEPEPQSPRPTIHPPVETAPEPVCGRLVFFNERPVAQQALEQLRAVQIQADLGSETSTEVSGYWVLIPALDGRAAGKAKVAELKAAGIKDVWLFAGGPLKNAISLGLFSTKANAGRRSSQVEKAGFKPVIQPKSSEKERFWLDYVLPAGAGLPPLDVPAADKLKQQPRECP